MSWSKKFDLFLGIFGVIMAIVSFFVIGGP